MVQSILNNLKNQTRRTKGLDYFNINPNRCRYDGNEQLDPLVPVDKNFHWFEFVDKKGKPEEAYQKVKCPYGQIGDILWVRESFVKDGNSYLHRASHALVEKFIKWKPSIHMPKDAARIFLEITNIRIERLHDISEADAKNEGIETKPYGSHPFFCTIDYLSKQNPTTGFRPGYCADTGKQYRSSFTSLWRKINGYQSWTDNPWVWVIEFKQIEKPQNFI